MLFFDTTDAFIAFTILNSHFVLQKKKTLFKHINIIYICIEEENMKMKCVVDIYLFIK